jgi:hypothetical protein
MPDPEQNPDRYEGQIDLVIRSKLLNVARDMQGHTTADRYRRARSSISSLLLEDFDYAVAYYLDQSVRTHSLRNAAKQGMAIGAYIGERLLQSYQCRNLYVPEMRRTLAIYKIIAGTQGPNPDLDKDILRHGSDTAAQLTTVNGALTTMNPEQPMTEQFVYARAIGYTCLPAITIAASNLYKMAQPRIDPRFRHYIDTAVVPDFPDLPQ